MSIKPFLLSAVALSLSLSLSRGAAPQFVTGGVTGDGSIETNGSVVYAYNFDGGFASPLINGVQFIGTNQTNGNYTAIPSGPTIFSISGSGGLDGTGGGTDNNPDLPGVTIYGTDKNLSPEIQDLEENGIYYNLTLTLDGLTTGQTYYLQLFVDANQHDARPQSFTDITDPANPVTSDEVYSGGNDNGSTDVPPGHLTPKYFLEEFTATGSSEVIENNFGGGQGAQFSGFVLETPEPSTWTMMGLGLVGVVFLARRKLVRA